MVYKVKYFKDIRHGQLLYVLSLAHDVHQQEVRFSFQKSCERGLKAHPAHSNPKIKVKGIVLDQLPLLLSLVLLEA